MSFLFGAWSCLNRDINKPVYIYIYTYTGDFKAFSISGGEEFVHAR